MGGRSPSPPDPEETAQAQTATNVSSAVANQVLNQVNQRTPDGSLTYNQTGSTTWTDPTSGTTYQLPQYTATQTLSPQQQLLKDTQGVASQNLAQIGADQSARLGGLLNKPFSIQGAPSVTTPTAQTLGDARNMRQVGAAPELRTMQGNQPRLSTVQGSGPNLRNQGAGPELQTRIAGAGDITKTYGTDFSVDRQKVEDALMQRMNPSLEQGRSRLETSLANQGIMIGTEAYDRAMQNFGQQENDARLGAILSGGQEQSRMVGMEANRAAFQNASQAQQFGQNAERAAFGNQGQQAMFANEQSRLGFNNQNAQAMFANDLAARGFNNQSRQQTFQNEMDARGFNNQTRQDTFDNELARTGLNNQSTQQDISNDAARMGFNNQAAQQNFNNQTQARGNWMNEQFALRNQPINEIASLLGTGQVQQPNFVNTPQAQMATTDYAGIVNQGFQNQMQQYNQRQQWMGGLLGAAAQTASVF